MSQAIYIGSHYSNSTRVGWANVARNVCVAQFLPSLHVSLAQGQCDKACLISCLGWHNSKVDGVQALGSRCMSAEANERPKFDEVLLLVDELDADT